MHRHNCAAYTLTELLIVVAVLAIAAVVAIPTAQPVAEFRADAAAGEVVNALRFARDNAQYSGAQRLFDCDTAANTIAVFALETDKTTTRAARNPVDHPFNRAPYLLNLNAAPAGNTMALVRCTFTFVDNSTAAAVAFDAAGRAQRGIGSGNARTSALRAGQVVLSAGTVERTIAIDTTGRITVS
ncbi:prepilin-type N-terminal cleavage/methylation domain-containing protein [Massilia sp. MP_M2]|uniref:prepilin-type N-terminal cleavage/methylation domain-containing protein n=1 Tax=Massilia sp. MP_M2 TaxID=3071713 RepID=UPI00319E16AA